MREFDRRVVEVAAEQRYLVTREDLFDLGGSDEIISTRIAQGLWLSVHPGVYQIDRRPLRWESELLAAVLAAGPQARASHRAALVLWGMDGIGNAPVEITMPFGNLASPEGAIVHRTRRSTARDECRGIPVSGPERTILECCRFFGPLTMGKALDSAIRKGLTTVDRCYDTLVTEGGRGVKGTRTFRLVLMHRIHDTATDSGGEYELLYHIQLAGLPLPVLHYEVRIAGERRVLDLYWPDRRKSIEVDGIDAHSSADQLDDDLVRQNGLMDLGIEVRRFSARRIRRHPDEVVAEIRKYLES